MTTFCLVHGACHGGWCWSKVTPRLEARGHRVLVADLPCDNPRVGLEGYRDVVLEAIGDSENVVLVGHSLAGITIPLVAEVREVRHLVFVAARVPVPGKSVRDLPYGAPSPTLPGWQTIDNGDGTFSVAPEVAREIFYHDCPKDAAAWATSQLRPQARKPIQERSPLRAWPDVERTYIVCKHDRVIPYDWSQFVARSMLGVEPVEIASGHSPFLASPGEFVEALLSLSG